MDIGSPEWSRLLIEGAAVLGVDLGPDHTRLFARHASELLKWNAVTNLTAITRPEAVALNHFLDSLAPARLVAPGSNLLDVGAGGGFPGLPLHIAVGGLRTILVDAVRKKVSFLRHVIRELALSGIDARHLRVEELSRRADYRQVFDVVTSRAFSALAPFVSAVWPLVRPGGQLIMLKGEVSAGEMQAFRGLASRGGRGEGLTLERITYSLPGLKHERSLLVVRRGGE
jgi:16S rRNA (guanine527-N7)-methyltransferase